MRSYGEFEFWFASIKVVAIVAFILLAGGYALGIGSQGASFDGLSDYGGFTPKGVDAILRGVFKFLINTSGSIALFVYLLIALSQVAMRRQLEREAPERLQLKMWGFPYVSYLAIAGIVVVIGSMLFVDSVRSQLYLGLLSCAVVLAAYWWFFGRERAVPAPATAADSRR